MTVALNTASGSTAGEILGVPTGEEWVDAVRADVDSFLVDHAACERKASAMAVSMICHYPDRRELHGPMSDLALEEMAHYREVLKLIAQRNVVLTRDQKDPYVNALRATMRRDREGFFQDRLLVAALIEARGAERFGMLATGLADADLRRFYRRFEQSEARHFRLFLDLADAFFEPPHNAERLATLRETEADIVRALPARAALH